MTIHHLFLKITLAQDENLYDGKKFISFETTDKESGISHYEVKEGAYPIVRAEMNYVLIDQKGKSDITVTAYNKQAILKYLLLNIKLATILLYLLL